VAASPPELFPPTNISGYVALGLAVLHPIVLLFDKPQSSASSISSIQSTPPSQPLENTIGAVALDVVAIVVVTSYLRIRLGRRLWKSFHFSIYIAAALFWHSLFTDPALKNSPPDFLDGGKLFVESCLATIVILAALRYRHSVRRGLRSGGL
jgi:predicted ferric reductase